MLPDGEAHKDWNSVSKILDALVDGRADRRSLVVALGGGVVGDVAGFAASIYMRGIRFVQMPTTLLAQVDSSVGGKTGINHVRGKNLIGAFHQPQLVLSDTSTLRTLPDRELSAGLAEILKHGLLADRDYFEQVTRDLPALRNCASEALGRTIARSCEIKAGIVARDERETGERALLNLGRYASAMRSRRSPATRDGCTGRPSAAAWCLPQTCLRASGCWILRRSRRSSVP